MDKWFKDILPDKDPYHNRGRDQIRKKGGPEFECLCVTMVRPSYSLTSPFTCEPCRLCILHDRHLYLKNISWRKLKLNIFIVCKENKTKTPLNPDRLHNLNKIKIQQSNKLIKYKQALYKENRNKIRCFGIISWPCWCLTPNVTCIMTQTRTMVDITILKINTWNSLKFDVDVLPVPEL